MQKMKYSGVEWIGDIPENWEIVRGRNLYSISTGKRDSGEYSDDGNYPFFTCSTEIKKIDSFCFDGEVLLISGNGMVGYTRYYNGKFDAYQRTYYLHNFDYDAVNINYLKYYVSELLVACLKNKYVGSVIDFIKLGDLKDFSIAFPNLDHQHQIADFLDDKCGKIDRYIEKQQQIIDKLKEYKQAVITEAVTKGLNPDVPMKDSGIEWIGMIPEHWKIPEIKYLVRIASGGTPDRNHPEYWNGNIPWIKTGELQNDIITNAEEYITEEGLNNSSAQIFNINTILVAMYGQGKTRGMTALLKATASTNQACAGLTVTNSNVHIEYLWQCLIGAYNAIRSEAAGSGQPNLSATLIGNFHIALPPIEEQGLIVEYIKCRTAEIKSAIYKAEKLLEKLTEYKKSLIYEAVTGKLEV